MSTVTAPPELSQSGASASRKLHPPKVAYFSMEIALDPDVPTYSGGLGVLAGDTLRSAADLGVPMVAVTLLYRKGYFEQTLDATGRQTEGPVEWDPKQKLKLVDRIATLTMEGLPVHIRCWQYDVVGVTGHIVPVYLLDAGIETNAEKHRTLTDHLYGGDDRYRFCQEMLLGIGGVEMLSKLGHRDIRTFHMNEGHSALLSLRLVERRLSQVDRAAPTREDIAQIRSQCVFTTHTPVPAGHDEFSGDLVKGVLGADRAKLLFATGFTEHDYLNMTHLALHHSNYVNGVAMKHGEVSREMFPNYRIQALTNGIHAATWTAPSIQELFDREIPEWRHDNMYLRYAVNLATGDIRDAHLEAKKDLFDAIEASTGTKLDPKVFTIGFARRATSYKRAHLLVTDPKRLARIAKESGPIQIVYGGKAHPRDFGGKEKIEQIFSAAKELKDLIKVVYVPNYEWHWGRKITSGVDIWLNTPIKPREASGTSGMKAAMNGVPSLSTLDGWWIEGHVEDLTGWSIDEMGNGEAGEVESLYDKLERVIVPLYYDHPDRFAEVMRHSMALNGSFFNTQRMLLQYVFNAYSPAARA